MEFNSTSQYFSRSKLDNEILPGNNFIYRTEMYLQQREEQYVNKTPPSTITTWKNLKYQKRMVDNDQAEIDRILSRIDSIHGTFNRSLLKPFSQVYSSLYGDDDESTRLMNTFCQCQDYCRNYDLTMKDDNDSNTQEISSSGGNFEDTDFNNDTEDEEEKENEKKKSYDSGYGSVVPKRQFSRGPFLMLKH